MEMITLSYPNFPRQAEFLIESIINDGQYQRIFFECIYDYDKNDFIIINEQIMNIIIIQHLQKLFIQKII